MQRRPPFSRRRSPNRPSPISSRIVPSKRRRQQRISLCRPPQQKMCAFDSRSPGRAWSKLLKPSRREGRIDPTSPVATTLVCFLPCTRGRGCGGHPVFPAPPSPRDEVHAATRTRMRGGKAKVCLALMAHCKNFEQHMRHSGRSQRVGAERRPMTGSATIRNLGVVVRDSQVRKCAP